MQIMILAKDGEQSETPTPPSPEAFAEFQKYNDELVKAGVVVAAGRLFPSSKGKRVRFDGSSAPSSTGHSRRPKSWWAPTGCGRCARWTKPSSGSSGHRSAEGPTKFERSSRPRRPSNDRSEQRSRC